MSDPSPSGTLPLKGLAALTGEERRAAQERGRANRIAFLEGQKAQAIDLGQGYTLTPDMGKQASGRGAGWKLEAKGQPDRWFRDPEAARAWLSTRTTGSE